MQETDPPRFFKGEFTLTQYVAFMWASDSAWELYEKLEKKEAQKKKQTESERPAQKEAQKKAAEEKTLEKALEKASIGGLRNYFAHYKSDFPYEGISNSKTVLCRRVQDASRIIGDRGPKFDKRSEENSRAIKGLVEKAGAMPESLFADLEKLSENLSAGIIPSQPVLALAIAPFLVRWQAELLLNKIWFCEESEDEKPKNKKPEGEKPKSNIRKAQEAIIRQMARDERQIILSDILEDKKQSLPAKQMLGLAIVGRLQALLESKAGEEQAGEEAEGEKGEEAEGEKGEEVFADFPEDYWFMKQLVLFIEAMGNLADLRFARARPGGREAGERSFYFAEEAMPKEGAFYIRYNTIPVQIDCGNEKIEGMFGLDVLAFLTLALILESQGKKQGAMMAFLKKWHGENRTRSPSTEKKRADFSENPGAYRDKLQCRIEYNLEQLKRGDLKLYDKIRAIADIINKAYRKAHDGAAMNRVQYKELEDKVRYYKRHELLEFLKEEKLADIKGLGLGEKNDISLAKMIGEKTELNKLYGNFVWHRKKWLGEQGRIMGGMEKQELLSLAEEIGFRYRHAIKETGEAGEAKKYKPVGLPVSALVKEMSGVKGMEGLRDLKGKSLAFALSRSGLNPAKKSMNFLDSFGLGKNLEMLAGESGRADGKKRKGWARTELLWLMARELLHPDVEDAGRIKIGLSDISGLKGMPLKIEVTRIVKNVPIPGGGNKEIKINYGLTQSWRNYALYSDDDLRMLIEHHGEALGGAGRLPLLQEGDDLASVSIAGFYKKMQSERSHYVRALILWEKEIIERAKMNVAEGETYIGFRAVCEQAKLPDGVGEKLAKFRNACFHQRIFEKPDKAGWPKLLHKFDCDERERVKERKKYQKKTGNRNAQNSG